MLRVRCVFSSDTLGICSANDLLNFLSLHGGVRICSNCATSPDRPRVRDRQSESETDRDSDRLSDIEL